MFWQHVRIASLAVFVTAAAASTARAGDCAAPCAPAYRTVCCTEWVPEQYQCTRTCYKVEHKQETYTAHKCECVPEPRTRTCTVYKMVPEVQTVTRSYCVCVPCVEDRTVMQAHVTCKPVTKIVRKCVDRGHWECRLVPCKPSCWERLRKSCRRDCCDDCCVPMKEVKCWVPCKVWIDCPVTCMERVCEYRPVVCKVTTYKKEIRQEQCQVTCCKCVPETRTENYTVLVQRTVAFQATRCVAVCVPVQETITCTRLVAKTVMKQVPCEPCCDCCCKPCCAKKSRCR